MALGERGAGQLWQGAVVLLGGLCLGGGCAHPPAPAMGLEAHTRASAEVLLRLPEALRAGATEGEGREVTVVVENRGDAPVVVLELWVSGLGEGRRRLAVPAPGAKVPTLRAFGFLPPSESVRYRLGVGYPRAGRGRLRLHVRLRRLPRGFVGRVMEEVRIPARADAGREVTLEVSTPIVVAPRAFGRRAALARLEGPVQGAAYSRTLGGWVAVTPKGTYLLRPDETREVTGLALDAVRLLDTVEGPIPVLDGRGRLRTIPRGPLLRLFLEETLEAGRSIGTATYAPGKEALRVE